MLETAQSENVGENLYEWSKAGLLQLVNVLPDGTSRPGATLGYKDGDNGSHLGAQHVERWSKDRVELRLDGGSETNGIVCA